MCIKNLLAKRRFFCCVRKMGVLGIAETGERRPLQDKNPSKANRKSKKYVLHPVSVGIRPTPAMHFQRACRQCVHESARLFRALCSHALVVCSHGGQQNRRLLHCPFAARTRHARLARLTRARGKSSQREGKALFDDFWYFSSLKSTIREKLLYDTSLSEFFSLVRKERKGQKEESFPLLNSFCRLAATGANKVPRPSGNCLTTATGSKRSSADSDLLLCHVRLWRTSRVEVMVRI